MRTTLDIDDDLLRATKELARRERKSAGQVVSELLRRGLQGYGGPAADIAADTTRPDAIAERAAEYGLVPFPSQGIVVTNEDVDRLRDELGI